jgi:uncharacterized membrane protein
MTSTREALRRTASNVTTGCLVPGVAFYLAYRFVGVWPAVTLALAWTYGAIAWRKATGRRVPGVLMLAAGIMTMRTAVAFAAGSPFLYFLQPVINDFAVGAVFLASMLSARPVVARLAPDFFPMDEETSRRPAVRRLFHGLTGLWGAVFVVKGAVMLWLLLSQPLDTYVLVRSISMPSANGLCIAATIGIAGLVVRREGLGRRTPVVPALLAPATS